MSYNILGINLSHNSSVCVLSDGEIVFFLEEERLSKLKHDDNPIRLLYYISSHYKINEIAISGIEDFYSYPIIQKTLSLIFQHHFPNSLLNYKYLPYHHNSHSSISFYNSGFKKSISIVVDGAGENFKLKGNIDAFETETIQITEYPLAFKEIHKSFWTKKYRGTHKSRTYSPLLNITRVYESLTNQFFNFKPTEAGKVMGLSSYGNFNSSIPNILLNTKVNPKIIDSFNFNIEVKLNPLTKEWHKDPTKITSFAKDFAFKLQQESQKEVGDLIEKAIKETGLKQVCCAGGYFLNCVANYYLTKRFPDIEFYFEPISSDAGNAIGAAKLAWYEKTQDTTIRPQKTLYYGPKYSKEDLLKGIQKYLD